MLRKRGIKVFLPAALQKLGKSGCNPRKPLAGVVGRWMEKGCEGLRLRGTRCSCDSREVSRSLTGSCSDALPSLHP